MFQAEVDNMVVFYGSELERLGVDVRLGTDAADLDLASYDNVLLATGTRTADCPDGAVDAVAMLGDTRGARGGRGHASSGTARRRCSPLSG